jgi:hypothetical protein
MCTASIPKRADGDVWRWPLCAQRPNEYEKGKNRVAASRLVEIARALQMSPMWLLLGEGDRSKTATPKGKMLVSDRRHKRERSSGLGIGHKRAAPPPHPKLSSEALMPRGDKSAYTDKQERKADHIAQRYEDRGVPERKPNDVLGRL